jgi:UDP-N-acetylglucosamine--N-acetylmuramyl-(pentapeptide) pyrophosphoryl-undecaprenol N-acetylglucosamine transferase
MSNKLLGKSIKIVLTGGHAGATAMSVIEELKNRKRNYLFYWIGAKYAIEGGKSLTYEYQTFPKVGVNFISIISGRLQTRFTRYTIPSLIKIPFSFFHAFFILIKIKPQIIVSFGGFASFPVMIIGKLLGIPVIIHEQTMVAGRANRLASPFVNKIALAHQESQRFFPSSKSVIIGNPISKKILAIKKNQAGGRRINILVTGGSRGSKIINKTIEKILPKLLRKYRIIHQTGFMDMKRFATKKKNLPKELAKNYFIYPFVSAEKWPEIFNSADIIISRAGANIVSEIIYAKKTSILIPLPFSYLDEQTVNAKYAQELGLAKILEEENLNPMILENLIKYQVLHKDEILKKETVSFDRGADKRMVDLIESFL